MYNVESYTTYVAEAWCYFPRCTGLQYIFQQNGLPVQCSIVHNLRGRTLMLISQRIWVSVAPLKSCVVPMATVESPVNGIVVKPLLVVYETTSVPALYLQCHIG